MLRIGIDIGGTFTDFVVHNPETGRITTFKIPSEPDNPASSVLKGIDQINLEQSSQIIHGSTIATNALLERKGARTALIATFGFKDVIQIGRQNRPSLYDWSPRPVPPLVPPELRVEVHERVDHHGSVLETLDTAEVKEIIKSFAHERVESVAVCLLFSFLFPAHEKLIADILGEAGYMVSASSEILPEYREYERTSTTVVNAYVSPKLDWYLSTLQSSLPNSKFHIMQSNGGMISVAEARRGGVRCILSGPAGGIVGAQNIAQTIMQNQAALQSQDTLKLITLDMGGTSTDVSLINGQPGFTTEASVGGFPIHLPMLDIHTIGAGGGSIAYIDAGGSLRVGPKSAGAYPGPACYGTSELPTVTDANLVLGRLLPDHFLGGQMKIDPSRAISALEILGKSLNRSAIQTALGIIEIVNAQMEKALRVISIERGHDPHDFYLFSFGGAGGLHAVELARQMDIPKVIISKFASTLSAYGMLASDVIKDYVRTVMLPGTTGIETLDELISPLMEMGTSDLISEGIGSEKIEIQPSIDARYVGQSYELNIPYNRDFLAQFHSAHQTAYGYAYPDKHIEIVNLRVRAIGKVTEISLPQFSQEFSPDIKTLLGHHQICLSEAASSLPVYDYNALTPGMHLAGPALIVSSDTTILINSFDEVNVDNYLNLLIDVCRTTTSHQNNFDLNG
jgi:N-methylhydantoinase A